MTVLLHVPSCLMHAIPPGPYDAPCPFDGAIDEVRMYRRALSEEHIRRHAGATADAETQEGLVLAYSFDRPDATDSSGQKNDGTVEGVQVAEGKIGRALRFNGRASRGSRYLVQLAWSQDVPLLVRAMVLSGERLVVAGPPKLLDEEYAFAGRDCGVVYAFDERNCKLLWKHLAAGRVASPPTIYRQTVLFGSADGRVTCLRLDDGALVWRRLAAPSRLCTVALDRVESLWPVHGSVLLLSDVAYVAAGRSTWLDGGIDLFALDPTDCEGIAHES